MHVERTIVFEADLQAVQSVLVSDELARARAASGRLDPPAHTLKNEETAPVAVTSITVPASRLPAKARRFLSKDTTATITQTWDGVGPDRASADFTVDVGSLPVKVRLTQTLTASGGSTTSTYSGDVKVSIPFVGAKIEQAAASHIDEILSADQRLVNDILRQR